MSNDNILKTHIRSRIGANGSNNLSLVTDLASGESELELTLEIKVRMHTSRIDRVKRLWGAVGIYRNEIEHKLKDIVDPKSADDYELTEKGINADE